MSNVEINKGERDDMKVITSNVHGFAYCDHSGTKPLTKTMVGDYLFADSASEEEEEIEAILDNEGDDDLNKDDDDESQSVEAGGALDDNSLVAEPKEREDVWMNT